VSGEAQGKRPFAELDVDFRIILKSISADFNKPIALTHGLNL